MQYATIFTNFEKLEYLLNISRMINILSLYNNSYFLYYNWEMHTTIPEVGLVSGITIRKSGLFYQRLLSIKFAVQHSLESKSAEFNFEETA